MTPLARRLAERILGDGPITFRDFMEAALHDPDEGYYAKGPTIGAGGDFYTSANLRPFAWGLAQQVVDAWRRLGKPDPFRVVELGGGTGDLATNLRDDLADHHDIAQAVELLLVEPNAGLAKRQRERGFTVEERLDELPPAPTILLANEVLDALPVHRVVGTAGGVEEVYVDVDAEGFVERRGPPSTPDLPAYFADAGVDLPEGHVFEVNLDARRLVQDVGRVVEPGYALFVDYGERTEELVQVHRREGTLVTYHEHRVGDDPYVRVGEQDITADVDWGAVERWARETGFTVAGYATQGRFLMNLGLVDHMERLQRGGDQLAALQVKNLLMPGSMGERFKVLGLARDAEAELAGFESSW